MNNKKILTQEMKWLDKIIQNRISNYFEDSIKLVKNSRDFDIQGSFYGEFIERYNLNIKEQKVIALALATHIAPNILDIFLTKNTLYDLPFTEFGGVSEKTSNGFIPTIATALFILSGNNREEYIENLNIFEYQNRLFKQDIIISNNKQTNIIHHQLSLTPNALNQILNGKDINGEESLRFLATPLKTKYNWEDLVLPDYTKEHLKELDMWLNHSQTLLNDWGMSKSLQNGYKALFYGSSGTGKTLTVSLLGKRFKKSVYRINLSQVVSKYIGETEKNLDRLFDIAQNKNWILFFDEADSLFSKRTGVNSSNDKYANQETAYLLQRVEESKNMIILATNLKDNFDEAFLRRFQSIIYFPLPDEKERLKLWQKSFSNKADLSEIDLESISKKYELSGANIINIVRLASLMAINRDSNIIKQDDIIMGIRRELYKEGKII